MRDENPKRPVRGHPPGQRKPGGSAPRLGIDQLKSRESRTRWDELQYFMVNTSCVRCRKTLQAPVDKLHYKLRCPHCGTLMHLREDGKWYEGVHPSISGKSSRQSGGRLFGKLQQALSRIPVLRSRVVQVAFALGVIAALAYLMLWPAPADDDLPTALRPRAALFSQAVLLDDEDRFSRLVHAETRDDAEEWYRDVRELLNRTPGQYHAAAAEVLFENRNEGIATTVCRFQSTAAGDREYVLYWRLDGDGSWKVDGTRTQREM